MDMQNIENQFTEFKSQLDTLNKKTPEDKCSLVVFSGDLDKAIGVFCYCHRSGCHGNGRGHVFHLLGHTDAQGQSQKRRW